MVSTMFRKTLFFLLVAVVFVSLLAAQDEITIVEGPLAGMKFVHLTGGNFEMGSPPGEGGREKTEGPVHSVNIKPFYMMTTEVTQGQWEELMGSDIEQLRDSTNAKLLLHGESKNHPVCY